MDTNWNLFASHDYELLLKKYQSFKNYNRIRIINERHFTEFDQWSNLKIYMIKIIYNPVN